MGMWELNESNSYALQKQYAKLFFNEEFSHLVGITPKGHKNSSYIFTISD